MKVSLIKKRILNWVQNFRATGSAMLKKPAGRLKSMRIPENIVAVRASTKKYPSGSPRKYASALRMPNLTVRQILHWDLKLHPYNY